VLIIKHREHASRQYSVGKEMIFSAGKIPSVEGLLTAIGKEVGCEEVSIAKYFNYNFEWVEISVENIEKMNKGKKKAANKNDKKK